MLRDIRLLKVRTQLHENIHLAYTYVLELQNCNENAARIACTNGLMITLRP